MARPRSKVPRRRRLFQLELEEFPEKSQNVDPCPPGRRPYVCVSLGGRKQGVRSKEEFFFAKCEIAKLRVQGPGRLTPNHFSGRQLLPATQATVCEQVTPRACGPDKHPASRAKRLRGRRVGAWGGRSMCWPCTYTTTA